MGPVDTTSDHSTSEGISLVSYTGPVGPVDTTGRHFKRVYFPILQVEEFIFQDEYFPMLQVIILHI